MEGLSLLMYRYLQQTHQTRGIEMKEAPDIGQTIGQTNGNTKPESGKKSPRINWKKDNVTIDAKCAGVWVIINEEGTDKKNFGQRFVNLFHRMCEAQWGKKIHFKDYIMETQKRELKMVDLYNRSMKATTQRYVSEDPRVNEAYLDNWNRMVEFLKTGTYPPAPAVTYVPEKIDIVPDDFEW